MGGACCRLGADEAAEGGGPRASAPSASQSAAAPPPVASSVVAPQPAPSGSAIGEGERSIVGAAHILIAFKGAELAPKGVTRSKEEARKRAEEVLSKVKAGSPSFAELAQQYSDDASKVTGGAIGNFERNAMPAAFSDAAFGMPVGSVSDIVETPRGFHIIQRTR